MNISRTPMKRWTVKAYYVQGAMLFQEDFEELSEDFSTWVENLPDWNALETITIRYNRKNK
jgi:hypothetical protein